MALNRREHLVETALALFMDNGIRATGIDRILRESGVAKKTLYNHFASKDDLVVAALGKRHEDFMAKMRTTIARLAPLQEGDPRMAGVLAYFDGLGEWFASDSFNGCTFINASAEFPQRDSPVHLACQDHKEQVLETLEELLTDLKLENSALVARQIAALADGAIVSAHTRGDREAAKAARGAAQQLLESCLG